MAAFDTQALASLRQGLAHFRAQDYFAAHDAWEEVWQDLSGRRRMFWQAMIQLVVGAYHWTNGNLRGCRGQWHKAFEKCDGLAQQQQAATPAPVLQLRDLLATLLTCVEHGDRPLPVLDHFAADVMSDAWFTVDFS
ncbi:MAG: DUF309 domain-containing protein [Candidatus Tectimicrobiota bacterium]